MKTIEKGLAIGVTATVQRRICDARTGKVVWQSKPRKNLVLDFGLNGLAKRAPDTAGNTATAFQYCRLGSGGSVADKIQNPAVTYDQTAFTVTASSAIFTAGMVGAILKYDTGSAGLEQYILAYISSTQVTVDTSQTLTLKQGTIWMVQRTAIETAIAGTTGVSNTYQTGAGDCGTSYAGNQVTHKRTFLFAEPGAPYTVSEICWSRGNTGSIFGRLTIAGDTINPGFFYVVVLSLTYTYSPSAPTAVPNVGTNIDTAGNAMLENFSGLSTVSSAGASVTGDSLDDNVGSIPVVMPTATYTQNLTIASGNTGPTPAILSISAAMGTWTNAAGVRGQMTSTVSVTITTAGQTLYGVGFRRTTTLEFDVKFTATFTAPTGSFKPTIVFRVTYDRTLTY